MEILIISLHRNNTTNTTMKSVTMHKLVLLLNFACYLIPIAQNSTPRWWF